MSLEDDLLDRWLAGTASAEEQAEVARALVAGAPVSDASEQLRRFVARRGMPSANSGRVTIRPYGVYGWRVGAAMAAALVAIGVWRMPVGPQQFRDFATTPGNRATVTLRDGTRLVLGPATHVRVQADFGRDTRTVELDGEAYFAVVHDASHPFLVRARGVVTRDVGTEFDVRNYATDPVVRIAVTQGRVAVRGAVMGAGDIAIVDNAQVTVNRHTDVASLVTWMQGGLSFHNTPLSAVAQDLARTFDLTVVIADSSLARQPVTATFGRESADDILDEITDVVGARYERVGQRIVIRRRTGVAEHRPGTTEAKPTPLQTARAANK